MREVVQAAWFTAMQSLLDRIGPQVLLLWMGPEGGNAVLVV